MPSHYYIDIPIVIIFICSFLYGFRKGLIGFALPWVSIIATFLLFPFINNFAMNIVPSYAGNIFLKILFFVLSYVFLRIILENARKILEALLKLIFLAWVNKIAGALFISSMSLLIIWLIYVLLAFVIPDNPLELSSVILNAMTSVLFRYFNIYELL